MLRSGGACGISACHQTRAAFSHLAIWCLSELGFSWSPSHWEKSELGLLGFLLQLGGSKCSQKKMTALLWAALTPWSITELPKVTEGLSWLYTLVFFLCCTRALYRFWIAVGGEIHPQRCSFLCPQKFLSLGEGRYITLPKQLWDWLWEYTGRQH